MADTIATMSSRGKRSSGIALILAVIAAVVGWFSHTPPSRRGSISLPPVQQSAPLAEGKARVTKIVDGDTVHALVTHAESTQPSEEKVRLYGINAPELHPRPGQSWSDFTVQPYAQEASDFLEKLCPPGSEIRLDEHGRDKYGRLLAVIILPDGRDANKLLIEAGLARAYLLKGGKSDLLRQEYENAQENAKSARRGIWK
jgi:micrococcal nuclease